MISNADVHLGGRPLETIDLKDFLADIEVPATYTEGIQRVKKTSLSHRKPRDRHSQQVNTGVRTGPKLTQMKKIIMAELYDRGGKELAERFSSLWCTTGLVPDPCGSMGALDTPDEMPQIVKHALCFIEALAWKIYGLEPVFHNFPVNSQSSVTMPYYYRGPKGVLIKKGYHEDFMRKGDQICDELSREDVRALHSAAHHLPIYFSGTTGLRIQCRAMKEMFWQGNQVVKTVIKPNRVTNWKGEVVWANMDVPGDPLNHAGKGRGVAAQSSTSNQPLGEATAPVREAMNEKGMYHSSDWGVSWNRSWRAAMSLGWDKFATRGTSTDFSRMDGHMKRPFMEALLNGIKRAGWTDAFLNLKRYIEFSPMICPCDSKNAPASDAFARMLGLEAEDHLRLFDAGHHSGSAATDVDNGIFGGSIMTVAQIWAGNVHCEGYSRTLPANEKLIFIFRRWIDSHWDTYFEGLPTPGDHSFTVGNKGDDHVTLHDSAEAEARYKKALEDCAPYLEISLESRTTFLGTLFLPDGQAWAADDKFFDNNVNPETSIDERPYWMIGQPMRMEHYASNPTVAEHLLPVLEKACSQVYGETWTRLAALAQPPSTPPQPINAAELNFLYDPSVLMYKYKHEGEIRRELIEATGAYFFIEKEEVEHVYRLFRGNTPSQSVPAAA